MRRGGLRVGPHPLHHHPELGIQVRRVLTELAEVGDLAAEEAPGIVRTVHMSQVNFLVQEDGPADTRLAHINGCSHDDSWHEVPFSCIAGGVRPQRGWRFALLCAMLRRRR